MIYNAVIVVAGLLVSRILFCTFPILNEVGTGRDLKVSVIIPARNEGHNLPLLLEDLRNQSTKAYEIICVDDCSTDETAKKALLGQAKLVSVNEKPYGWMGKSWACQIGAVEASGDVLLFLDADVRLARQGLERIIRTFQECNTTISILPYHKTTNGSEKFSLFFNLVQFAGNGLGVPGFLSATTRNAGLYGPVIMMERKTYFLIGGHEAVRSSIIEDLDLGNRLKDLGFSFRLFIGSQMVSYRMYSGGMKELVQGWIKNQAEGASRLSALLFAMMFLWVSSCIAVPVQLIISLVDGIWHWTFLWIFLYILWVLELRRTAPRVGNFTLLELIIYPVYLFVFLWIFFISVIKTALHLKVIWKDRDVRSEK